MARLEGKQMDQIRLSVEKIADLSAEEIDTLREELLSTYQTLKGAEPTREIVDQMSELASFAEAILAETSRREAEMQEMSAAVEEASTRISALEPQTEAEAEAALDPEEEDEVEEILPEIPADEDEVEAPVEDEEDEDIDPVTGEKKKKLPVAYVTEASVNEPSESIEAPAEAEFVSEPDVTAELSSEETEEIIDQPELENEDPEDTVTAAASTDGLIVEVPETHRAQPVAVAPVTITAGADIPGVTAGSPMPNLRSVAQALIDRKKGMGRTSGGDGEQHTVATFSTTFPEDRTLRSSEFDLNASKISSVVAPEAIVAAGGLLAPVETSYEIFGLGELGRPVRDSLAVFGADRGGIRFLTPPVLSDLNGAVSLWTIQDDIDAATDGAPDPVKPCIRVDAGAPVEVFTDAIPLCLTFGNIGARTFPEMVERHTQLGLISHARYAETRILTRIGALSTSVSSPAELGAARDVFVDIEQAAAAYRNRHRMAPDAALRVIFPEWFKNALRADLTKQLPGSGQDETFALTEAKINSWFAARDINPTWALDGETGQVFGTQAAGALNDFPATVIWYLFSEGTFLFLDGGTLDLGLVRDSTLNGTNDYKIFLETFEGVAKVGIESLRVSTTLKIAGATAATVATIS